MWADYEVPIRPISLHSTRRSNAATALAAQERHDMQTFGLYWPPASSLPAFCACISGQFQHLRSLSQPNACQSQWTAGQNHFRIADALEIR
jgi:hypothetical protein